MYGGVFPRRARYIALRSPLQLPVYYMNVRTWAIHVQYYEGSVLEHEWRVDMTRLISIISKKGCAGILVTRVINRSVVVLIHNLSYYISQPSKRI